MSFLKNRFQQPARLLSLIATLTLFVIIAQIVFFIIHYKVSDLLDSLVQSSLKNEMLHVAVLLPLIGFLLIQIISYGIFIGWTWFLSVSLSELFKIGAAKRFWVAFFVWFVCCVAALSLNSYFFPDSFFAHLITLGHTFLIGAAGLVLLMGLCAYVNCFLYKRHLKIGSGFLVLVALATGFSIFSKQINIHANSVADASKPNIIFIGLDSVRPDFINARTPNVKNFLQSATIFTDAYTPLARTFTGWMSILTAQYPKHSNARTNLADPDFIHADETLAKRLKAIGYETIYGTDEKRFSNITERYGFDHIIGPSMGVNDFILGSLSDFPLTNLMVNSALGRFLFPYNFANRAAAITYEPDTFLQLVKLGLVNRENKPVFLAIHLCVSHWPYTWARDKQPDNFTLPQRYASSVQAVDQQLGELLQILKQNGLLEHSLVVLLSDHGTTVGLPHDRLISEKNYLGDRADIKKLAVGKLSTAPSFSSDFKKDYSLGTSYGQGTDVLSLKQYHILLAFKGFGVKTVAGTFNNRVALMDIAPTVLEFLKLPPFKNSDGVSLDADLSGMAHANLTPRALFIETGYSIAEIQTDDIFMEKVLRHSIGAYQINPLSGLLSVKSKAEKAVNFNRQRAVLMGDWMLARYPSSSRSKLAPIQLQSSQMTMKSYKIPAFFVIANIRNGKWGIGLDSPIAKDAPMKELLEKFFGFYGDEV